MVFFNTRPLLGIRNWFSGRIQKLQKEDSCQGGITGFFIRLKKLPKLWSSLLLLGSLSLGLIAHDLSQSEALREWEKNHGPSKKLLRHALLEMGMKPIQEEKQYHRLLRTLPAQWDESRAFWVDQQANWVAQFFERNEAEQVWFFCRDCSHPPKIWDNVGTGWGGFQILLETLEKKKPAQVLQKKVRPEYRDPRAIVY